ncbi:MAG TPA: hypothetical protein VIH90_07145 [Candidatus Saccharimonadales bacterium]
MDKQKKATTKDINKDNFFNVLKQVSKKLPKDTKEGQRNKKVNH